jgi:mutator protein MutT
MGWLHATKCQTGSAGDRVSDYIREMRELIGTRRLLVVGAVALIVNEADEILLVRRTDMPYWGLPAGALELGETISEALEREVREETSLEVIEAEPMGLYSGPRQQFTYPNGDEIQNFTVAFLIRRWQGQPKPDGVETSDVRFFPLAELPADMLPLHRDRLDGYRRYEGKFLLLQ